MYSLYTNYPNMILGFHGCEQSVGEKLLRGEDRHLTPSENDYDWLGKGIYFWENNPSRALDFAISVKKLKKPFVIGAIISLGKCLDLMDHTNLQLLKQSYENLKVDIESANEVLPKNTVRYKGIEKGEESKNDKIFRYLDCAVVQNLHRINEEILNAPVFQSVRGLFTEGKPLYEGAGFNKKNHIQLCIRNNNCIKGYFRPLEDNV